MGVRQVVCSRVRTTCQHAGTQTQATQRTAQLTGSQCCSDPTVASESHCIDVHAMTTVAVQTWQHCPVCLEITVISPFPTPPNCYSIVPIQSNPIGCQQAAKCSTNCSSESLSSFCCCLPAFNNSLTVGCSLCNCSLCNTAHVLVTPPPPRNQHAQRANTPTDETVLPDANRFQAAATCQGCLADSVMFVSGVHDPAATTRRCNCTS